MEDEYLIDMEIQEDELDREWLDQPKLMLKYTKKLAIARDRRDLLKEKVELMKAEIDKAIRDDPSDFGLEKVTDKGIEAAILRENQYQEVQDKARKANFQVNVLTGVVQAVEQRKQALENLVRLHGQSYFAGPSVPHDLTELREQRKKETHKKIARSLKRTN